MLLSLAYLKNLVRDPNIASITPTSRFGVARVCGKMDFSSARAVVEYGPATGVFTKYLLRHLGSNARVFAFETNGGFHKVLTETVQDPRLTVFHETCELAPTRLREHGFEYADYVISGIPFSFLDPDLADRIVKNTKELLRPGGKFLVYQFLKPEKETNRGIHRYLPVHFSEVHKEAEWLNIPPLSVYEAVRTA